MNAQEARQARDSFLAITYASQMTQLMTAIENQANQGKSSFTTACSKLVNGVAVFDDEKYRYLGGQLMNLGFSVARQGKTLNVTVEW